MENVQRLTELQNEIGYVAGVISPVAMLGLIGEVGEVAAEVELNDIAQLSLEDHTLIRMTTGAIECRLDRLRIEAEVIDTIKKRIRKEPLLSSNIVVTVKEDEALLDDELADVFYYLNAICIGRGITIDDLAKRSITKVIIKRQVEKDFKIKTEDQ